MKKILTPTLIMTLCLAFSILSSPVMASALPQAATPPAPAAPAAAALPPPAPEDTITFEQMGLQEETVIQGPFDSLTLNFSLPPDWKPGPGSEMRLHVSTFLSVVLFSQNQYNMESLIAGGLEVTLNGVLLDNPQLHGNIDQVLQIAVPENALFPDPYTGMNRLQIAWNASSACDYNLASSAQVHLDSVLILPHQVQPIPTSLENFPSPIYLQNSTAPAPILLLVPDKPSQAEIQAALTTSAGLGRLSGGKADVALVPLAKLSDEQRKSSSIIAIGKSGAFDFIKDLAKPISPDDGIVQLDVSPWNPSRGLLAISGQSDAAVVKAALAASSGKLVSSAQANAAFIRDIAAPAPDAFKEDQTFADLGMDKLTFTRFGNNRTLISFFIPPGTSISPEAYLELSFNHSQLIDYLQSGIVARLNGTPIGSARLSDTTAPASKARMVIPTSALQPGVNQVELQMQIQPRNVCDDPRTESLWISIFPDSVLHLPVDTQIPAAALPQKVSAYPLPFSSNNGLEDTAFILAAGDADAWKAAARLAYNLGSQTNGSFSRPEAYFADSVPQPILESKNLLVIGRPSQLPVLAALSAGMPAAFAPGDELSPEVKTQISFDLPAGTSLGYLEIAPSALSADKINLFVLGSSSEGVNWAASALVNPAARRKLDGNFAMVQGTRVTAENIQSQAQPQPQEGLQPQPTSEALSGSANPSATPGAAAPNYAAQPLWLLPSFVLAVGLILALILWQAASMVRRKR